VGVTQVDPLVFVAQSSDPGSECRDPEQLLEGGGILGHHEVTPGGKPSLGREREVDAATQTPTIEHDRCVGGIEQLDELRRLGFVRGIIMDLVDDRLGEKGRSHPAQKADKNCRL
jgi:hypothetical protein